MKNKVYIVGDGGREDSLRWKLTHEGVDVFKSGTYNEIYDHNDLVIIGPEVPIADGLTDELISKNIPVFGPSRLAGRLETSKLWAKQFMKRHGILTADRTTHLRENAEEAIKKHPANTLVIKEDGLCGGKGVVICPSLISRWRAVKDIVSNKFNSSSDKILIEDFIKGEEASCFVLTDGKDYKVLPYCQDHKRVGEGDTGPNTGGMGAYAPAPLITTELDIRIKKEIIEPTIEGMHKENIPYKGVLYIGLMICNGDPYVIEYNVRFGDPECQVLVMLMKNDLLPYLNAVAHETLGTLPDPEFFTGSAITVVMCSKGYPEDYSKGFQIDGLDEINDLDVQIFHAGTRWEGDRYVTDGGRVLNVTGRGISLKGAQEKVYNTVKHISWEGSFYRRDIGYKAL